MRRLFLCIIRGLPIFETGSAGRGNSMAKCFMAAVLGLACLTGCRMCACPYDDCYPVIESDYPPPGPIPAADDEYAASGNQAGHQNGPTRYAAGGPRLMRGE
jgi:hypothetical protein